MSSRASLGGVALIEVPGVLDVYTAPMVRESLTDAVVNGARLLIVDLTGIQHVDSTGLGVLVGGWKRVRAHEGDLVLVCDTEGVCEIFRKTGLTKVFAIFSDVASARAHYSTAAPVYSSSSPRPGITDERSVILMAAVFAFMIGLGVYGTVRRGKRSAAAARDVRSVVRRFRRQGR